MKDSSKGILGIAIFYAIAVAILDYFLARIPIVNWLALSVVFVFFTILILDSVITALPARKQVSEKEPEIQEDELVHLEEIVKKALVQHQPHSQRVLEARVKAILIACRARKVSGPGIELNALTERGQQPFRAIASDAEISKLITGDSTIVEGLDIHGVERILSKIEAWLA